MGCKGNKRGNPAWYRGMPSANPNWVKGKSGNPMGRPRGQTSLAAYQRDRISTTFLRWERFCWALPMTKNPGNGAEAARRAGYSPKSARFIACRLLKKPVIRAILQRQNAMVYLYSVTENMEYSTTGNMVEKMRQFQERARRIRQDNLGKSSGNRP